MTKYADIIAITAPDKATPGDKVNVVVKVKNIDPVYSHVVRCIAAFYIGSDSFPFLDEVQIISPGETNDFSGSFTMPDVATKVQAFSYYPVGTEWIYDDTLEKSIGLAELTPVFSEFSIKDYRVI